MAQKVFTSEQLTSSDVNTYLAGEGGAWTSFSPSVVQSGAVTVTNTRSRYARYGRTIHFTVALAVTGTGTSSNPITVTLPVTAATSALSIGAAYLFDSSASLFYPALTYLQSTTTASMFNATTSASGMILGGSIFTDALASGDSIYMSGTYEAAS